MGEQAAQAWLFGPRQPLPVHVPPVWGESTGSYVSRLAHGQGLQLEELLERVGFGQASTDPVRVRAYPSTTEMYVNEQGLEYLAVLCGSTARALQEDLPSTAAHLLEPTAGTAPVWTWPWLPRQGHLVPLCGTCAVACGVRETVWMISADRWRVCLEHLRWTDSDSTGGEWGLSLKLLAETVEAHREREALSQRYGPSGRELFADAFQIAVHWWTHLPDTARWVHRAWDAGLEAQTVPTAPLVLMPEAAAVAMRLAAFEHLGRRDGQARTRWMEELRSEMDQWGVDFSVGRLALMDWLTRHSTSAVSAVGTARQARAGVPDAGESQQVRGLRLSAGHERAAQPTGVLGAPSCLPWQLGQPACEM
ncbi:TniQ family protein [Streptomyces sp. NPDC059122]|uniref:TniQ family protein n=1 Tax=Streptomyces sp. NPDC059122 TaxID=3346732 RepID=UPI0036A698F6